MSTSQPRGFGSLVKGKFDSGVSKLERALREAGGDPAGTIELLDTNDGYRRRLAEFATRGVISMPASYKLARRIMGKNLFGPEECSFYGISFTQKELRKTAKFPWSEEILDSECPFNPGKAVSETHFAYLGLDRYNGPVADAHGPLTTMAWQKIHPAGGQPRFYVYGADCWYLNEQFAAVPLGLHWHLTLKEIVSRSPDTSWADMQGMIPEAYEVPSPIVEVTKVILYYRVNGVYLNRNYYGATDSLASSGGRVIVGRCNDERVYVSRWYGLAYDDVGLSLVRKSGV